MAFSKGAKMSILYILIPLALFLGALGLYGFFRSVWSGQFDDLETPAYRALLDDTERKKPE
jgi:cbb3-type cytochrome oxidase maturation protein